MINNLFINPPFLLVFNHNDYALFFPFPPFEVGDFG